MHFYSYTVRTLEQGWTKLSNSVCVVEHLGEREIEKALNGMEMCKSKEK